VSFLFVLLFGAVVWLRPVLGYALFMLLQTPLRNVAGTYAHVYLGAVVLILATVKLLVRKSPRLGSRRLRGVEICALALSLLVLVRQVELQSLGFAPGVFAPGVYWRALSAAFLWGPLLVGFNRLDEKEMPSLRLWMSVAGIVVGVWGLLIYLTGNGYLMRTAIWTDPDTSEAQARLANTDVEMIVTGRFIVMGLFTVAPWAYWYVLRDALAQTKQHWLWNLGMWAGVGTILIAVGISVSRGMLLLLGMGTVVMLVAVVLRTVRGGHSGAGVFAVVAMGACVLGAAVYLIDFTVVMDQFGERFSTFGVGDKTIASRLESTAEAWAYLKQNLCFFGAASPDSIAAGVDTAVVLRVWLFYGVSGAVLFSVLFFTTFRRLFQCWLSQRLSPENQLLRGMLTAWALGYVYVWIAGYSLHPPEVFFTMLFVSEIDRLKGQCLITTNSKPRRTAA
jgi:hypothetical protein